MIAEMNTNPTILCKKSIVLIIKVVNTRALTCPGVSGRMKRGDFLT